MKKLVFTLIGLLSITMLSAQDTDSIPAEEEPLNIQQITPAILMRRGQWEYKMFNNLYTQTRQFGSDGKLSAPSNREIYFKSINQFLYGINGQINVGFEFWIASRNDGAGKGPFELLNFSNSDRSRTVFAYAGPRIKLAPVKTWTHFSIQSTFLIPMTENMAADPFVSEDSYIWINQFLYDLPLSSKFTLFMQVAPWIYFNRNQGADTTEVNLPTSIFVNYFPSKRVSLYFLNEYWPTFGSSSGSDFIANSFYQMGGGTKYQLIPGLLELELLYTKFLAGKNSGAGETFNLGIRVIR